MRFVNIENDVEVNFVTFDMTTGTITLQPGIETEPSIYALKMQIYLADYPSVIAEEAFVATVLTTQNCAYDKITFGQNIASTSYVFSNPVNTMVVDPKIIQSVPDCPRECKFYENTSEIQLPSPFIESFDSQTGVVNFRSNRSDLNGSVFPMLIVCESLESTLGDTERVVFDRFTVTFEVDCSNDVVKFVQDFEQIHFFVSDTSDPIPVTPILSRTSNYCPVTCKVISPFFEYKQPNFIKNMDAISGTFEIATTDQFYIGNSITTELICTSVVSQVVAKDTFEVRFFELPDTTGASPCLADEIYYTSLIRDFDYMISYPANQLQIRMDYNQKVTGCPVSCDIYLAQSEDPIPEPPFKTYGTEAFFSVFTSDASYDGRTYHLDVKCHSTISNQDPIVQTFGVTFVHDKSSSDAAIYTECANDFISFNSELNDYDLPVSAYPSDIVFTPAILQDVPGCPIQCQARSELYPLRTPAYVLQFDSEGGQTTFSWSDTSRLG